MNGMNDLVFASFETIYLVLISTVLTFVLGFPLGTLLFMSEKFLEKPWLSRLISGLINASRSIPFIILLVLLIPLTRKLVGTSIGMTAALVPLTLGATPFFARLVDNVYRGLSPGLIEAAYAMGATHVQMIRLILIPEAKAGFIQAITVTAITLLNYSAMAGTVGGGGLGDLAIRYGYQRFNLEVVFATVLILIIMVQAIQYLGDRWARSCTGPIE